MQRDGSKSLPEAMLMGSLLKKVFLVFFGLYFALGFIAGNALAAVLTHSLAKEISQGMAWLAAIGCIVALIAAAPLPKVAIRIFDRSAVFGGNSLLFWRLLTGVSAIFGALFGALLPNGPFNG